MSFVAMEGALIAEIKCGASKLFGDNWTSLDTAVTISNYLLELYESVIVLEYVNNEFKS